MITDTFDNLSPAIIHPRIKEDAPEADACIVTFSHEIEKYVAETYVEGEIASLWCATGRTPVYLIRFNGKRFAFYKTYVGAPITTALVEDAAGELKCRRFILFGGAGRGYVLSLRACGGLRFGKKRGDGGRMHEGERHSVRVGKNLDHRFLLPRDPEQF